eukprot:TRINITY_DN71821_c0_g1_i1.p1 TRINITY_DN71821_c0_g1~~TRINITY_DN71821_c0_g1_i1.p1  ORF type:complete len:758 (-),score=189.29 TRINITY_DN71821_c0_g1_i1:73-2346(-)
MAQPLSSTDVADALQRLSAVTAGRSLSFPEGSPQWSAEDIQAHWNVVAHSAGADGRGPLAGPAADSTKVLYDHVETVIISSIAPDCFDIYEACFETLAKIGSFLQDTASKEILYHLLEEVSEVYDVLLSCVETYEWVQPGATGLLRLWMMQVIVACVGAENMTGLTLMELTNNDVSGAVSLISFILQCEHAPFELQDAAGRCLVELTTADSVFMQRAQEGDAEDMQNQQIAKLTAMLNRHVNGLIKGIIQFDTVEAFGRSICFVQMSHTHTDIIVKHFLTTIHNCLLYCSENQKKLRQHLATQSSIVAEIMIPYVNNILPALYDHPNCGPQMIEWQNLKATLTTFVVVTFNINVFRPAMRDDDIMVRVCAVPNILTHISMLELLIKICLNVDFTKGPHADHILACIKGGFDALPTESALRLRKRLTSDQSMRLAYSRAARDAVAALSFALAPPEGAEVEQVAASETRARARRRKNNWRSARAKRKKRLFAMRNASAKGQEVPGDTADAEDAGEADSDSEDEAEHMIGAVNWESSLGRSDEAGVPSGALCQLTGTLMHDPVATPDGYIYERAALEDWMTTSASNPLTGAPLSMDQCVTPAGLQENIQGYQMQMLSACQIAPGAFEEPPPMDIDAPAAAPPAPAAPAPATGPSLLGDLPTLQKEKEEAQAKKKEKGKIRIESRSVVDCPEDMRCAIDGKVCVNPLRSPYGHLFEKKTLERWVQNCGSVCPITGKALRIDECTPDAETKKRIVRFLKGQQ